MCIAIPGQVSEVKRHEVKVEYPGITSRALLGDEKVKVGDYVMVQMGIVIKVLTAREAKLMLKAWKDK